MILCSLFNYIPWFSTSRYSNTKEDNKALQEKLNLRKALNKEENRGLYTAKDREKLEKDIGKLYKKRNEDEARVNEMKEKFNKKMKESGKLSKEGLKLSFSCKALLSSFVFE
jgi:uncharacterized protein YlxW (UPF0749 family)